MWPINLGQCSATLLNTFPTILLSTAFAYNELAVQALNWVDYDGDAAEADDVLMKGLIEINAQVPKVNLDI